MPRISDDDMLDQLADNIDQNIRYLASEAIAAKERYIESLEQYTEAIDLLAEAIGEPHFRRRTRLGND